MPFNSLAFALFFPAVFAAYWTAPLPARKPLLLAASLGFYAAWDWRFLGLILLSAGTDYLCGRRLGNEARPSARKALLLASVAVNLGILGAFKYFHFFVDSFRAAFPSIPEPAFRVILPVGISFFTFQGLSYTLDIYRRELKPASALDYFLFVAFFPQLLSGPIVRASEFLPQLRPLPRPDSARLADAALLFARGFAKKVFLADTLAAFADPVFADPSGTGAWECLLAAYAFAFQIYFDFSGYTDMARATALALGFRFPENFDLPYLSASPREFWRRWHMTLSAWLRDYLYKGLGGDRWGKAATLRNLFLTMALGGLWHGASWTFVVWGCYHGALLALQRSLPGGPRAPVAPGAPDPWRPAKIFATFHLVVLGWIFFRAGTLELALAFLGRLASLEGGWHPSLGAVAPGLTLCAAWQVLSGLARARRLQGPAWQGFHAAATACAVILALIYSTGNAPFLYFQF